MHFAHVYAWTSKTPLTRAGATARRHHPNPAEAHRRWRGERSEPVRLGVRDYTRSLCGQSPAQSEQRRCSVGPALDHLWVGLLVRQADHLWVRRNRANSCARASPWHQGKNAIFFGRFAVRIRSPRQVEQHGRDAARLAKPCRSCMFFTPQLKREESAAHFRPIPRKLRRANAAGLCS